MEEDVVNVATLGFLDRPGHDALCFKSQEPFLTRYHCHSSAEQIRYQIFISYCNIACNATNYKMMQ